MIPFLGGCRLAESDRTVARNYITALQEAGRSANTIRQAKMVLGAMFGMAVADGYLDYNPFHDVKIPKVPGRRAIKIATPEQYARVRGCLPTKHLADLTGRSASPQHVAGGGAAQPMRAHRAKPGTAGGTSDDGPRRATAQAGVGRPHPHGYLSNRGRAGPPAAQAGGDRLADIDRQRQLVHPVTLAVNRDLPSPPVQVL